MVQVSPTLTGFEDINVSYTDEKFRLGELAYFGGIRVRFVRVAVAGGLLLGDWAFLDGNVVNAKLTTAAATYARLLGVAQTPLLQNEFGWVAVGGQGFVGLVAASFVLNTRVYSTATAGVVDDSVTAGVIRGGLRGLASSTPGGLVAFESTGELYVEA